MMAWFSPRPVAASRVNQVQQPRAERDPVLRGGQRRIKVHGFLLRIALVKPHGAALLDVHAGHNQGRGQGTGALGSHAGESSAGQARRARGTLG